MLKISEINEKFLNEKGRVKSVLLNAYKLMLVAEYERNAIKFVYDKISTSALAKFKPTVDAAKANRWSVEGSSIEDMNSLHLANDSSAKTIYEYIKVEMAKQDFLPSRPEFCAYCESESKYSDCKRLFLQMLSELLGHKMPKAIDKQSELEMLGVRFILALCKSTRTKIELDKVSHD